MLIMRLIILGKTQNFAVFGVDSNGTESTKIWFQINIQDDTSPPNVTYLGEKVSNGGSTYLPITVDENKTCY